MAIRSILHSSPRTPKITPKSDTGRSTQLQAEAQKLDHKIKLARMMNETQKASELQQRLRRTNTELTNLDTAASGRSPARSGTDHVIPMPGGVSLDPNGNVVSVPTILATPFQSSSGQPEADNSTGIDARNDIETTAPRNSPARSGPDRVIPMPGVGALDPNGNVVPAPTILAAPFDSRSSSEDGTDKTTTTTRNTKTGETTTTIIDPKAGTEINIVTDKDGRTTKTTTEKLNGGKPIDYKVKQGDNLTLIAQQHGATLDELRKTNPGLFDKPRDPNLIHPGEKVRIENGTRTTVEVTANGYTLTTKPDGKITLHNNTTGTNLDIKAGTAQEALATLLLSINPESKDPETAKTDTVLKTTLEVILGGASPELLKDVRDKQQAAKDAVAKYGGGKPGQPKLDGSATTAGPFGAPPKEPTKSGGKWTPDLVDGSWLWFDPEVKKALAAENTAIANLSAAQAKSEQAQAQLDVYALDPAYKEAINTAKSTLGWAPTPKGTLAEAQQRLILANDRLEKATTAKVEYTQGEKDLIAATDKQATLPAIGNRTRPDGPTNMQVDLDANAKHSEVSNLFIQSSLHTAKGNKATVDLMVSAASQSEVKLTTKWWTGVKPESLKLKELKTLQMVAGSEVTLAEAYAQYEIARKNAVDLTIRVPVEQIKQIIAQARQRNPQNFDEKGFTNGDGDFSGKLLKQEFFEENGQLYMVNTYENDIFPDENNNDTNVLKVQLTYGLNDGNIRDDFRNDPLNRQWQNMPLAMRSAPTSAPVYTPDGLGTEPLLDATNSKILDAERDLFDKKKSQAEIKFSVAKTALDQAITDHPDGGTTKPPVGTLKPGEQPVKITVNDRDLWVAPEVAAAYEKHGAGAIGDSGKTVQIEMNGQKLWVHPQVAFAEIDRGIAEVEMKQWEKWATETRPKMVAAGHRYSVSAQHPQLIEDDARRESELSNEVFQVYGNEALGGYLGPLENLYDQGFTGKYKPYKPDELNGAVARILGLDPSSEEVEEVTDEIHDRAGENAKVKIVPIFALDGGLESMTALFQIRDGDKDAGYVDSSGKHYDSFDEFQHENRIFSDKGKLVMAKGGEMSLGADGKFTLDELEVVDGRKVDFWDKATDIGLGVVTGAGTVVSFFPGGQWAIPIALTSGAVLGGKTLYREGEHLMQGGEFDSQSAWNVATGVVSFLPLGAGSLRTFGLMRSEASSTTFQSVKAGFGMMRTEDASWSIGKFKVNVPQSSYAGEVSNFMRNSSRLNTAAWGLDAAGFVAGVPILTRSATDLALHGDEMSFAELANAIMGIGTGALGTGLGARGLLHNMPGAPRPRGGDGPTSGDIPPTDTPAAAPAGDTGSEPWLRHVYEAGPDGVYRPTGRYVVQSPDEIVIQGEVISEKPSKPGTNFGTRNAPEGTPKSTNPTGPRALPAGTGHGPEPTSPTVGKGEPSGDGETSGVRLVWDPTTRSFSRMPERDTSGSVYTSSEDEPTPSVDREGPTSEQQLQRHETNERSRLHRETTELNRSDDVYQARPPMRESVPDKGDLQETLETATNPAATDEPPPATPVAKARQALELAEQNWKAAEKARIGLTRAVKSKPDDQDLAGKLQLAEENEKKLKGVRDQAKVKLMGAEDTAFENRAVEVLRWAVPEVEGESRFLNGKLIHTDPKVKHAQPDGHATLFGSSFFSIEVKHYRKYDARDVTKVGKIVNSRQQHLEADRRHVRQVVVFLEGFAPYPGRQLDIALKINGRTDGKVSVEDVFFLDDKGDSVELFSHVVAGRDADGALRYEPSTEVLTPPQTRGDDTSHAEPLAAPDTDDSDSTTAPPAPEVLERFEASGKQPASKGSLPSGFVWNPQTRRFSSTPEPDTSGYGNQMPQTPLLETPPGVSASVWTHDDVSEMQSRTNETSQQAVNVATGPSPAWPPAIDRGKAVFDPVSGKIVSHELPVNSAAEPGYAQPVRMPTRSEVKAISTDQMSGLSREQLNAIKAENIARLTPEQVAAFLPEQFGQMRSGQLAALRPKQLQALSAEQLQAIRPSKLEAIAPGRIPAFSSKQLTAFSHEQLAALTKEQVRKLTPDQIAALSDEQRNAFTAEQFEAFRPAQFNKLEPKQVAAFKPDLVATRNPATTAKMSPDHIAALTREQLDALTIHQIEALTKKQVQALTPKQLGELSPGQLRKFTPKQFEWMTTKQTNALSVLQLTTFWKTHNKAMTPDQAAWLKAALIHARIKENIQFASALAPMASSSYGVWTSLPQPWSTVASGVAFTIRGAVFTTQALLPNATANHKPLGRILNAACGLSFILSSPSTTEGTLRGTGPATNFIANSTFSIGNVIFGPKSVVQAFTGRPVMRTAGDHLGNFLFVTGSGAFMACVWDQSTTYALERPLDVTSITLFTLGTVEFWTSAIRADKLNRKAVPRTEEDINARAESDARWGKADRIALGLAFGVGMFLFAWDTIDRQLLGDGAPGTDPGSKSGVVSTPPDHGTDKLDPGGPSNLDGRTNPKLEQNGYRWVEVKNGDSIRLIATANSADVADTVVLNMDHILSPDAIFAGDRVYLPNAIS